MKLDLNLTLIFRADDEEDLDKGREAMETRVTRGHEIGKGTNGGLQDGQRGSTGRNYHPKRDPVHGSDSLRVLR